jgi:hypothetical protein
MALVANCCNKHGGFCGHSLLTFGSVCAQIDSLADYNEYCHYTAGLMGLGLTRLFYTAGIELFTPDYLSNAMGLFLQVRFLALALRKLFSAFEPGA